MGQTSHPPATARIVRQSSDTFRPPDWPSFNGFQLAAGLAGVIREPFHFHAKIRLEMCDAEKSI